MSTIINQENNDELPPPSAYFGSLTIENVKCFKGIHEINLSDADKPAMWTVILGDNNTGKTTLLKCLADLEPVKKTNEKYDYIPKIASRNLSNNTFSYLNSCKWIINNTISEIWRFTISYHQSDLSVTVNSSLSYKVIGNAIIYGYGTSRRMSHTSLSETENQDNAETLFNNNATLINTKEWLLQTYFAEKLGKPNAAKTLIKIKQVLTSGILPDVQDFRFDTTANFQGFVEFKTDYGWVKLRDLGYGYQVTLAWIVDLAKKLFERYPNSENPLHEPAIVLIDEIDLHLHPQWQRKIISFLSQQFPKTQFIATTHSPLIVQSAENINLVLLEKQDDHVIIKQPDLKNYRGWTVDEILSELMGLEDKTLSDDYLKLMRQFDEALDNDNYHDAKTAYDALDKILHPTSVQRKLLRIQMASLMAE
ncbi:MAG: AAA family ATPase [Methylococcaceae bacterium]